MSTPGSHRPHTRPTRLIPFFRNERLRFLHITTAGALRAVLVALVVMAMVVAYALWRLIDLTSAEHHTVQRVQDTQDANHQSRLEFERQIKAQQAYTEQQVRSLACSVVAFTPPARANDFVRSLARTYHCPPYRPARAQASGTPPGTPTAPRRSVGVTATNDPRPATPARSSSATPGATPSATSSAPRPGPPSAPVCLLQIACLP